MRTWSYITWWVLIFVVSYTALSATVLAPAEVKEINAEISDFLYRGVFINILNLWEDQDDELSVDSIGDPSLVTTPVDESILPVRVIIDKIGVDEPIENPESSDTSILDEALSKGVVRYPGSGGLTDDSNIFLFGHSTNWQTVRNQAYKAFNRLSELNLGDFVKVRSNDTEYLYSVTTVELVDKSKALVEFKTGRKMITLSTCDTFGSKSDRFVVEARFVRSYPTNRP